MCANYIPVTDGDELLAFFGVQRDFRNELPAELYPTGLAPFIRLVQGGRAAEAGRFGLLPPWNREVQYGRNTYNVRNETIHLKSSFRDSWRRGLRCIVPAKAVYEERYNEDLTHERWRIENADGTPLGVAGIYSEWLEGGVPKFSFSMVTVNCDGHSFYAQFHEPGHEKRMPVFLEPHEYDAWMTCPLQEASRFFRAWPGPFKGFPEARAPRQAKEPKAPRPAALPKPAPKAPPTPPQGDLF